MDQFGWGAEFLRVNEDVLETYAACADGAEVVKAQVSVFNGSGIIRSRHFSCFHFAGSACGVIQGVTRCSWSLGRQCL